MKGPRYDCFGPWPVYPDEIVRRYICKVKANIGFFYFLSARYAPGLVGGEVFSAARVCLKPADLSVVTAAHRCNEIVSYTQLGALSRQRAPAKASLPATFVKRKICR